MAYAQKEHYMRLLIEKAKDAFRVSGGNPCVGAMLVHGDEVISMGIYDKFGGSHAEVNCIDSVPNSKKHLIPESTLYVTLEPCCVYGKTPPCTNKILSSKINKVVIATRDPNPIVEDKGIEILRNEGVEVEVGVCEEEAKILVGKFRVNILHNRPYIALKMAISKDGYSGKKDESIWLTNEYARIQAHKLRGMFEGIVVGYNTVNLDNPDLTNREYFIAPFYNFHPVKIIIDKNEKVNKDSKLFSSGENIIITSVQSYKNPSSDTTKILFLENERWNWSN